MTNLNLYKSLEKAINTFDDETSALFNGVDSDKPATKQDLFELSRQTSYVMDKFKKILAEKIK